MSCVSIFLAIKGMFSFFTALPIDVEQKHVDSMNREFWLVPIVGLFYGLFAGFVFCLTCVCTSRFIAAAATIFCLSAMNRFLHLDGTVDMGDGLIVAGKKEDHVRALKDTLVGAGGTVTGIMVVLMLFAEYSSLNVVEFVLFAVNAEIMAKNTQVVTAAFGNAGNGMAGDSVRYTTPLSLIKSTALSAIIILALCFLWECLCRDVFTGCNKVENCWAPVVVGLIMSIIWGLIMANVANRNFGIVNGDVLGATNETSRVITILFMIFVDFFLE
ncbi:MAG: adenosylcobinamide-GDP ribazoletransferase [archaeon]|nr:adenosylcobinamide-GDP ribazoletransferase [archaeon]